MSRRNPGYSSEPGVPPSKAPAGYEWERTPGRPGLWDLVRLPLTSPVWVKARQDSMDKHIRDHGFRYRYNPRGPRPRRDLESPYQEKLARAIRRHNTKGWSKWGTATRRRLASLDAWHSVKPWMNRSNPSPRRMGKISHALDRSRGAYISSGGHSSKKRRLFRKWVKAKNRFKSRIDSPRAARARQRRNPSYSSAALPYARKGWDAFDRPGSSWRIADCPYHTGWQREAWQSGAWDRRNNKPRP